jgi:antitoxin (DNA-binding transcriptional repressor) of toxin-antitoxin stability system
MNMKTVTILEAREKLPDLIHKLTLGEELVITENNQPVAKLIGEKPLPYQRPQPGLCKGMITIVADDEEHLRDFSEYIP